VRTWRTGAYCKLAHMANWLIWRNDYGKSAYDKLAHGETTSIKKICKAYFKKIKKILQKQMEINFHTTLWSLDR